MGAIISSLLRGNTTQQCPPLHPTDPLVAQLAVLADRPNTGIERECIQLVVDNLHKLNHDDRTTFETMMSRFFSTPTFRHKMLHDSRALTTSYDADYQQTPWYLSWLTGKSSYSPTRPSRPRASHFRYLDLPAELRIMIAEHTLHEPQGLHWKWLEHRGTPKRATFANIASYPKKYLSSINALNRTCKTVYRETRGIVLAVNDICFDCRSMFPHTPRAFYHDLTFEIKATLAGLEMFLCCVKYPQNPIPKNVYLEVHYGTVRRDEMVPYLQQLSQIGSANPNISLNVTMPDWTIEAPCELAIDWEIEEEDWDIFCEDDLDKAMLRDIVRDKMRQESLTDFIEKGEALLSVLNRAGVPPDHRGWRFTPYCDYWPHTSKPQVDSFEIRYLSESERERLQAFYPDGL